ncbi:hypothetical protein AMJ83_08105 [candidate division WOR_3 bacterium SM23_42]|uniref:Outer membrane protein beta-barrel domain-containing protein n=1 Tax=candidate division WOR_3 bacterium SM23_42 TaxID=1703779 RepID=A0A0S8FTS4_UNCW3|nr:MAG: hypothetical protein AMJ83_08105 [candidate division WOR_3 bacterium SM23_42]
MKRNGVKWLAMSLVWLIPLAADAAKYGVLHLKPVGVSYATTEAVATLLTSDLINYGHTVLNPDAMDDAVGDILECYESSCAAEAGLAANVEHAIYGSVSRLGDKHIVQLSIVNVLTKEVVWAGSLAAKTAEDLDTVVKRLAKSISEGKKAEETVEVGLVTEEEEKKPARRRVFHTLGVTTGMLQPISGYGEASTLYHLGALYWYETPRMVAEVAGYVTFPGDLNDIDGTAAEACFPEISMLYMLSKKEISPYFGGGIGFGWLTIDSEDPYVYGETAYGMTLNAGGGVVFFRTYDIRLILDARYRVNLASVRGIEGPHQGFKLSVGFTYRRKVSGCFGCGLGL